MTVSTKSRRSERLPDWLQRRIPLLGECSPVESIVRGNNLHTVCREALCPNRTECYSRRRATFLILGGVCTRGCRFCAVSRGAPHPPDPEEPARIARAREPDESRERHRDVGHEGRSRATGGRAPSPRRSGRSSASRSRPSSRFSSPISAASVESLAAVLAAGPEILSHNVETVRRLYARGAQGRRLRQIAVPSFGIETDSPGGDHEVFVDARIG